MYSPPPLLLTSQAYFAASLTFSPVIWSMVVLVPSAVKLLNLPLLDITLLFCLHHHSNSLDEETVQFIVVFLVPVSSSIVGMITELLNCGSWNVI